MCYWKKAMKSLFSSSTCCPFQGAGGLALDLKCCWLLLLFHLANWFFWHYPLFNFTCLRRQLDHCNAAEAMKSLFSSSTCCPFQGAGGLVLDLKCCWLLLLFHLANWFFWHYPLFNFTHLRRQLDHCNAAEAMKSLFSSRANDAGMVVERRWE